MLEDARIDLGLRPHFDFWQTTRFKISLDRPKIMGILNATPDSFAQSHDSLSLTQTLKVAERLLSEGADILDIGGESTRPGSTPVTHAQEWVRIEPILQEILNWQVPISVDTYHPETMRRALDMGVDIINDVFGLRVGDALDTVAGYACGICLMHMHGEPLSMQQHPLTGNVVEKVTDFFSSRLQCTDAALVARQRLVLDPGIGFGKTVEQNFKLLNHQDQLSCFELPLLVGWSRKSSLGAVTGLPVADRVIPSVVAALISVQNGASIVRVHDVAATFQALQIWNATTKQVD